jgi:cobyrinic acid a,c-diamide synthase
LGQPGQLYRGHEFHYASITAEGAARRLFSLTDAAGRCLPEAGLAVGSVMGSFIHLLDREDPQ